MQRNYARFVTRLDTCGHDPYIIDNYSLDEFLQYIEIDKAERVFVLSQGQSTGFDDVLNVTGNTLNMLLPPEDLVFES